MSKPNKAKCRQAVEMHHGGFKGASDAQIMTIWNSLDGETKKRYLQDIEERKASDAVSDQAKSNVRGGSKH